jgi:hypothetical protein
MNERERMRNTYDMTRDQSDRCAMPSNRLKLGTV